MKPTISITIITFFLSINFALYGQIINNKENTPQFFPLKVGNYWVYSNSNFPGKLDTIKITNKKMIGLDTGYVYNNILWFEKNDTVYDYQSQRIRIPFRTLIFFPSDKKTEYFIFMAGDVVGFRTVRKLTDSYVVNGKEYFNCYEYETRMESGFYYTTISYGIGIIETRSHQGIRSLIEYKIE